MRSMYSTATDLSEVWRYTMVMKVLKLLNKSCLVPSQANIDRRRATSLNIRIYPVPLPKYQSPLPRLLFIHLLVASMPHQRSLPVAVSVAVHATQLAIQLLLILTRRGSVLQAHSTSFAENFADCCLAMRMVLDLACLAKKPWYRGMSIGALCWLVLGYS
jgi:hypothetical protein